MEAKLEARTETKTENRADNRTDLRGEIARIDLKREFIVERQGRMFVLYAGLLDLAHRQGLKAIRTRLLQVPSDDNGQLAICYAEVETDRGVFSGIGDASPDNVSRPMVNCTIRLAETRAKARALRDAINVGVAALEELGDDDDVIPGAPAVGDAAEAVGPRPVTESGSNSPRPFGPRTSSGPTAGNGLATPAQVRAIYLIGRDQHGLSEAELDERSVALYGSPPAELTKKQASDFITSLKAQN